MAEAARVGKARGAGTAGARAHAAASRAQAAGRPPAPPGSSAGARRGGRAAFGWVAVLALAGLLRAWRIGSGLPDFVEEAIPFRKALAMWGPDGHIDWNPHFFHHPSLSIYLHLAVQQLHLWFGRALGAFGNPADYLVMFRVDPAPMAMLARSVGIVAGWLSVLYVGLIGERLRPGAGPIAALLAAVAASAIAISQSITSDAVMIVLMLAALERMLAYREQPERSRLIASVILMGLATGAKYPAVVTLLPLAWVLIERHGARGGALWGASAVGALIVFFATTPYALIDRSTFLRDLAFVQRLGVEGHFGSIGHSAFSYHLRNWARDLGWVGLAGVPVSFALVAARVRDHGAAVAVWTLLLAFALPLTGAPVLAERYIVPITLLSIPLVCAAFIELAERLRAPARVALVGPAVACATALFVSGPRVFTTAEPTHHGARRWCETHLTHDDLLVQEFYGASLHRRLDAFSFTASPAYAMASEAARRRFTAMPWFSTVTIPLAVVGSIEGYVPAGDSSRTVVAFEQSADLNPVFYDLRLFTGVPYVLTSDAVRARYVAEPQRYAAPCRFYALLDSLADVVARFPAHPALGDPEIVIYRLGAAIQSWIDAQPPLDPLWWAEAVPHAYRERVEDALAPARRSGGALRDAKGDPAAWVASLATTFESRIAPFSRAMALEHFEHGRPAVARRFAASILAVEPEEIGTCLLYVNASRALGRWQEAREALERSIRAVAATGPPSPWLSLEYADALARDGETEAARIEIERVMASGDAYLIGEAQRRIEDPTHPLAKLR